MKNNKLIAEFMGDIPKYVIGHGKAYNKYKDYSKSWDLLMPVLDKIKEIRCLPDDHDESFSWVCKSSDIEAEYNAVVEFIKQYNNEQ